MALLSASGARFRQRKISVKQSLQVLKQRDIPDLETEDQQRELQHIETGVEKGEEEEHHLQQVIHASEAKFKGGKVDQVYIPTPDASKVWKDASKYYSSKFQSPTSYIKFSATVEDTSGCLYNMDEVDEEFLNTYNSKQKESDDKITEDEFELLADKFESTVNEKQPYLTIDPSQIMSFDEIKTYVQHPANTDPSAIADALAKKLHVSKFQTLFDCNTQEHRSLDMLLTKFGEVVYEHWKSRRIQRLGKPVFPTLRFEDKNHKDDSNPYTAFRRREFRQTRKTRRTDTQSIEKLKHFFKEMKRMNNFISLIAEKEASKSKIIQKRKELFQNRNNMRIKKRMEKDSNISDDVFNLPKKMSLPPIDEILESEKIALKKKQEAAAAAAAAELALNHSTKGGNADETSSNRRNNTHDSNNKKTNNQKVVPKSQPDAVVQNSLQPYVKLPPAKVPDLDLTTVNTVLLDKHENIRKAVMDKLKKRRDGDIGWINFTDDPYNPYFDMSINDNGNLQQLSHFPCSAIVSSLFEVENSRYINFSDTFNSHTFYTSATPNVSRINAVTGELMKNDRRTAFPEYYDITGDDDSHFNEYGIDKEEIVERFNERNRLNVSEVIMKLRKRKGRHSVWVDRKRIDDDETFENFLNFSSDEELDDKMDICSDNDEVVSKKSKKRRRNVYDCASDSKKRLRSRYLYDRDLPIMNTLDPSTLNRIGKQAQVIRFGSMLSKKAYDNMTTIRAKQYNQLQQLRQQQLANQNQRKNSPSGSAPPPKERKDDTKNKQPTGIPTLSNGNTETATLKVKQESNDLDGANAVTEIKGS